MSDREGWIEGGNKGDKGDAGAGGATGPAGADGAAGAPGAPGTTLHSGLSDVTANQHHNQSHGNADHTSTFITQAAVTTHEGLADPHTGYRLESADHTHASTGLQAGTIDHGIITGLSDDDHPQYALDTDLTTHAGAADPHTGYLKESVLSEANVTDLTDGGTTTLHSHTAAAAPPIVVNDEGTFTVPDTGFLNQRNRLTLTTSERASMAASARVQLWDIDTTYLRANAQGSVYVINDEFLLQINRLESNGNARSTLVGNGQLRVSTLDGPVSRLVLAGRG